MHKKSFLFAVVLAWGGLVSGHATSVTLSSSPMGRNVVDETLVALNDGDLVWIGTFSDPSAIDDSPVVDLSAAAGWTQFGSSLRIGSIFGNPGKLLGTVTDTTSAANFFNGKPIYLWIFNAPTASEATGWGVFTAGGALPEWVFPVNNGGIGDLLTLSADAPSLTAVNGLGVVSGNHLQLVQAVPEPGTFALFTSGLLAALVIVRRRRRAQAVS